LFDFVKILAYFFKGYMNRHEEIKGLEAEIDLLKQKLNKTIGKSSKNTVNSSSILEISKKLDTLITRHFELKKQVARKSSK